MTTPGKMLTLVIAAMAVLSCGGCSKDESTALISAFHSYETVDAVRQKLTSGGSFDGWTEQEDKLPSGDRRPRRDFLILSGPYRDHGFEGRLRLTFFNDRLMMSEFRPKDGPAYLNYLRRETRRFPSAPGQKAVISRHTELRYYVDPNGTYRVLWEDQKLDREWMDWVTMYS